MRSDESKAEEALQRKRIPDERSKRGGEEASSCWHRAQLHLRAGSELCRTLGRCRGADAIFWEVPVRGGDGGS